MLQPYDVSSPDSQGHKFMVQTMIAPTDFNMDQFDNVVMKGMKYFDPDIIHTMDSIKIIVVLSNLQCDK